jgi:hypothetical protein
MKEIEDEVICDDCFTKFKSTKRAEIEEELRRSVSKTQSKFRRIITYTTNIIVPGAGLIYQGRNFVGLIIVFLVSLGYIPFLFSRIFVRPSGWLTLPPNSIVAFGAIIAAIVGYILSFSLIRSYHAD